MTQPDKKTDKAVDPELDADKVETPSTDDVSDDDAWLNGTDEDQDDDGLDDSFLDDEDSFLSELDNSGLVGNDDLGLDGDDEDTPEEEPTVDASEAQKEIAELKAKLASTEAQLSESEAKNDKLALQLNEAQRVKERLTAEFEKKAKLPLEKAVKKLLDPLDNFERAIEAISDEECANSPSMQNTKDGLEMTLNQIIQVLDSAGIKRVETEGKFDHNVHEAISTGQDPEKDNGAILQVLQTGYQSDERLLRPARVIVNKK